MHQVIYNNKLEHKCTLTLLDTRVLYVGPIQAKGHLFVRNTCPDSYSYLSVLCILCLAACGAARHLSIPCSVGQFPSRTMQCWSASNIHYSASRLANIVFVLFRNHIYQNYIVLQYIWAIGLIYMTFMH